MPKEQDGGPVKRGRDSEPSRLGFQACHGLFQVEQVDSLLSFSFSIRNVGVIVAAGKDCHKDRSLSSHLSSLHNLRGYSVRISLSCFTT